MPPQVKGTAAHPLLVHVYGEPHGQTVRNMWPGSRGLWHRMLAQQGYVVVSVDNRGTMSPRGRAWRKSVHRQIGILASQEQAAAVEQLLTAHPEIDRNRVGVWGWSGGGSMSLNAIFRYRNSTRQLSLSRRYRINCSTTPFIKNATWDCRATTKLDIETDHRSLLRNNSKATC